MVGLASPVGPQETDDLPSSTEKEILSTATWLAYRLVNPSTVIIMIYPTSESSVWLAAPLISVNGWGAVQAPADNHDSGDGEEVSIGANRALAGLGPAMVARAAYPGSPS
jgi:hypothetical protein